MSVQEKCSIVKIVDNKIVVNEINTRQSTSSNWDSYQYLFIDNVNLQKTPLYVQGILICIMYNDHWQLAMLMQMKYSGVSFCLLEQYSIFIETKETLQELDVNQVLKNYFGVLITLSLHSFSRYTVLYLNQVSGSRPFGQEYNYNPINSDSCYDCSVDGPDVILPNFFVQTIIRFKILSKVT